MGTIEIVFKRLSAFWDAFMDVVTMPLEIMFLKILNNKNGS